MKFYYYITNSTDPDGMFEVTKARKGQDEPFDEFYMQHWGNYFVDKESADKMCRMVNKLIHRNGVKSKDKNGNRIYIGDIVSCIKDGAVGEIASMSPDGTAVSVHIDGQDTRYITRTDVVKYKLEGKVK